MSMTDAEFLGLAGEACSLARKRAEELRTAAGFEGAWTDHGASELLDRVAIWQSAVRGVVPVPRFLRPFWDEAVRMRDPEWHEFERLRRKFGGAP